MTPCQRLKEKVFDLLDADLDSVNKRHLESHLRVCPHCSDFYRRLKRQKDFLKRLKAVRTEEHFIVLLRDRIRREMAGKASSRAPVTEFGLQWAAITASTLVIMATALWFSDTKTRSPFAPAATTVSSVGLRAPSTPVQYVIDDIRIPPKTKASGPSQTASTPTDTVKPSADTFEDLRSRLTPVSF